jgi:chorismate mutase/prephenate dehydratase
MNTPDNYTNDEGGRPVSAGDLAATDREIARLLALRAAMVVEAGDEATSIGAPPDGGPLGPAAMRAIFTEIDSACQAIVRERQVGYLGPPGTFSHEAALRQFGSGVTLVPCSTIEDVFRETERGNVGLGIVPVENSTAGAVVPSLEAFLETSLQIRGEIELPIVHNLVSRFDITAIRRVYSHPQSFAQCRRWLAKNLPNAERIEVASNALAVQMADSPDSAAIGPAAAARIYGLPIVVTHVEDESTNLTRFRVLGRERAARTGRDKSAVVFSVKNRPGALRDALDAFASRGVDLTRIESRPSRSELWTYVFFVDLVGHPDDPVVAAALADLLAGAMFVKVLGAWPV